MVIDGDLRHASASAYIHSPEVGLSNYLGGQVDELSDIIVTDKQHPSFSFIPVGTIPPNPTELLFNDRLQDAIHTLKQQYDVVLIDCPPVELVADTQIIEKWADRTVLWYVQACWNAACFRSWKTFTEKRNTRICL